MPNRRVCVVGVGVVGLSSAVCILEQCPRVEVTILADKFSPHTTSDVSGGFWYPFYLSETPLDLVRQWSEATWDHMLRLYHSSDAEKVGCQLVSGYFLAETQQPDLPMSDVVFGYRPLTDKELSLFPGIRWGRFHTTLQIDVSLYLDWLMTRFKRQGGKVQQKRINSLNEVTEQYDVVVNCSGLGSCNMLGDKSIISIRGQVIRYHAPWVKHFYFKMDPPGRETYIFPGARYAVVGGTTQKNNWNLEVNDADFSDIRQRALSLVPSLQDATVVSNQVGLRPSRTKVRLERETFITNGKPVPVIHNYGHGGSGVTVHWGCAQHTVRLVTEALTRSKL